jgi:hypothetical protein
MRNTNSKGKEVKARYKACILYIQGAVAHIAKLLEETGSIHSQTIDQHE